ncbi:hypothetical protein D4764_21G0004450 [Takifugu flavidus]|uniref:Uncharacterized protein n=1 Tax=Takifugu flavidus TaxID=433684 RepID=A0A5C6NEP7_9TELE|nr:hypothetical protein D4764_21G0004450 [Takifugu flavidus]
MGQQLPGERGHAGSRPVVFVSPIMLSSVKSGVLLTRLPFGARVPQQHLQEVPVHPRRDPNTCPDVRVA